MPGPYLVEGLLGSDGVKNPRLIGTGTDRKRACVCLVFRFRMKLNDSATKTFASAAELQAWLEGSHEHGEEEVLFIRRADNPRDRWSGHIAFPGGRVDRVSGEKEYDTATRECLEEVGVDLRSPRYALIGRLDDRAARGSNKSLVISPFVFMQLDTSPDTTFQLQEKEVSEAFWCSTRQLSDPIIQELALAVAPLQLPPAATTVMGFLGIRTFYFPCIQLQGASGAAPLWGLTYNICSDLVQKAGLPSFDERRLPRPGGKLLPFRSNTAFGDLLIRTYFRGFPRTLGVGVILLAGIPIVLSRL